jgi:hypothetical protein
MAAPDVPIEFTARLNGSKVSLSWKAASTGDTATEFNIQRGSTAGTLADRATVPASVTTYEDTPTDPGTYYYAVVAKKGTEASAATAAQQVTVVAPPVDIAIRLFIGYFIGVGLGIAALFWIVPFPAIATPTDHLDSVSGAVGAYLVRFGVILLIAAFVPALVEQLARTFNVTFGRGRVGAAGEPRFGAEALEPTGGLAQVFLGTLASLPDLLRRPAGYGVAVILLGVVLLIGASFGFKDTVPSVLSIPGASVPSVPAPTP